MALDGWEEWQSTLNWSTSYTEPRVLMRISDRATNLRLPHAGRGHRGNLPHRRDLGCESALQNGSRTLMHGCLAPYISVWIAYGSRTTRELQAL